MIELNTLLTANTPKRLDTMPLSDLRALVDLTAHLPENSEVYLHRQGASRSPYHDHVWLTVQHKVDGIG